MLTEFTGPNSSTNGAGSLLATQMAVADFMQANPGIPVEILSADHQAQADVALSIARGVDRPAGRRRSSPTSTTRPPPLAVADLVRQRDRVALLTGPASSDLTGKACGPNHVHWTYDTWALGNATGNALTKAGGDTWYFIGADYAFGHLLAGDTARFVTNAGGKVLGTVYTPLPGHDGFLRLPAAGAGERRKGHRPRQ
ncbi:MAG: ABC transporter substrate-binding protein [Acetobacteraceae bacterium]